MELPKWALALLERPSAWRRLAYLGDDVRPRVLPVDLPRSPAGAVFAPSTDNPKRIAPSSAGACATCAAATPTPRCAATATATDWSRLAWVQLLGVVEAPRRRRTRPRAPLPRSPRGTRRTGSVVPRDHRVKSPRPSGPHARAARVSSPRETGASPGGGRRSRAGRPCSAVLAFVALSRRASARALPSERSLGAHRGVIPCVEGVLVIATAGGSIPGRFDRRERWAQAIV
jgi:hypothetical protein